MQTDAELVKAVLNGQKEAFADLVRRYEKPVRTITISILGDHHSVQDTVQETFLAGFQNLHTLRKPDAFGQWIMKIAYRSALDWNRRRPKESALETADAAAIENADCGLDEDNRQVLTAVMKLPENERQVVMLRYFAEHSVKEVAEIIGAGVGTVTKELSRAHKRLQKILKESEL